MLKRVSEYINIYIYIHIYVVGFALRIFKRLILIVVVHACESKRISLVITAICNMECAKQVHLASTQTI